MQIGIGQHVATDSGQKPRCSSRALTICLDIEIPSAFVSTR